MGSAGARRPAQRHAPLRRPATPAALSPCHTAPTQTTNHVEFVHYHTPQFVQPALLQHGGDQCIAALERRDVCANAVAAAAGLAVKQAGHPLAQGTQQGVQAVRLLLAQRVEWEDQQAGAASQQQAAQQQDLVGWGGGKGGGREGVGGAGGMQGGADAKGCKTVQTLATCSGRNAGHASAHPRACPSNPSPKTQPLNLYLSHRGLARRRGGGEHDGPAVQHARLPQGGCLPVVQAAAPKAVAHAIRQVGRHVQGAGRGGGGELGGCGQEKWIGGP